MKRSRGRGRRPQNNQNHNYNNPNRTFDSAGPEIKIRGSASNVYEKYQQLARDASAAGDRVMAENYLQHAEHYYRIMSAAQSAQAAQAAQQQQNQPAQAAPMQQNTTHASSPAPASGNQASNNAPAPAHGNVQADNAVKSPSDMQPPASQPNPQANSAATTDNQTAQNNPAKLSGTNGRKEPAKAKNPQADDKPASSRGRRGNGRGKVAPAASDKNASSAPSFSLADNSDDESKGDNV